VDALHAIIMLPTVPHARLIVTYRIYKIINAFQHVVQILSFKIMSACCAILPAKLVPKILLIAHLVIQAALLLS